MFIYLLNTAASSAGMPLNAFISRVFLILQQRNKIVGHNVQYVKIWASVSKKE